jgi:hypothetical protein
MFERFTAAARSVVIRAREHAVRSGHHEIGAQDLLLGVLDDVDEVPARVLAQLGSGDPTTLGITEDAAGLRRRILEELRRAA